MFLILHYPMIFFCKSKVLFRHFRGIPIIVWIVDRSLGFSLVSDFVHNVESRSKVCSSFTTIDKMNKIARYNLIDTKYHQMAFWLARWCCSYVLLGNPWSNKSKWRPPEGDNQWNLLFSSRMIALKLLVPTYFIIVPPGLVIRQQAPSQWETDSNFYSEVVCMSREQIETRICCHYFWELLHCTYSKEARKILLAHKE